jgi:hypothetical protein
MIHKSVIAVAAAGFIAGCSQGSNGVRVTNDSVAAAVPSENSRSEPIFYNGKTYQLDFAPVGAGRFAMAVNGMGQSQQKDAVAVATSSLRYFKCPDGQNGVLTDKPKYIDRQWRMTARCS